MMIIFIEVSASVSENLYSTCLFLTFWPENERFDEILGFIGKCIKNVYQFIFNRKKLEDTTLIRPMTFYTISKILISK
jgi:hypothetical protein